MTHRPLPPPLHARLTVVRADRSPADVARRLAAALVGDAVDLRSTAATGVVITTAVVRDEAVRRAAVAFERRAAARDEAVAHRAGVAARRTQLLERAEWCETAAGTARALAAALAEAEGAVAAALADVDAATARRDRVADQRAATQAAVDQARLELEALDGATLDETGVRRDLEAATGAERETAVELEAAQSEVAALERRLGELTQTRLELVAARDELAARVDADTGPREGENAVREALAAFERAADRGVDAGATALADAIARVEAELADLRGTLPEPPTDGRLEGAEADVAAARRGLDAVRAEASSFAGPPPPWWVQLTAMHTELVEAEAALDGAGFRKAAARRRYEEAAAAERAALDELGFDSYLDALMSGGRRPDERAAGDLLVRDATACLAEAERVVEMLNADLLAGAPIVACLEERQRLLALARSMLCCDPADRAVALLTEHPAVPPTVVGDLGLALRAVDVPTAGIGVGTAARQWVAARDAVRDAARAEDIDRRLADVVAELHGVEGALGPARAVAERAATAATAAARTVASLEAELRARADDDDRLLERATAARALRDQVEAVEARLARAEADAMERWAADTEALAAAEAERERIDNELADVARRAARAAAELPADRRPAFDLVNGLVPLGATLRAEVVALGVALDLADNDAAEAEAACGLGPDRPTVADVDDAVRALVAAVPPGAPALLAEPFDGASGDDLDHLLGVLLELTADRPAVVVTADIAVVGWAIGLPADVGALVPVRSLDALGPADGAPTPAPPADAAVSARPAAD